jgi:hypothetical protein
LIRMVQTESLLKKEELILRTAISDIFLVITV